MILSGHRGPLGNESGRTDLFFLAGESAVVAALAFGATLYRKKGTPAVSIMRRVVSAIVICAGCLVSLLTTNLAVSKMPALSARDFGPHSCSLLHWWRT
jgi:hypothetical protein